MVRRRLDAELVRRGLAGSPMEARDAVRAGLVVVAGRPATKASTLVGPADPVEHNGMSYDPVVAQFVEDALAHPGPANPAFHPTC